MKKTILIAIVLTVEVFASQTIRSQGTLYVSNLEQTPTGSAAVASDAWLAQAFFTGTNSEGYILNSIQLPMNAASGSPSGFTVSLYSLNGNNGYPESSLGSLSGSDPTAGGLFTYTASDLTLLPSTVYFVVLTAATPVADGYYSSSIVNTFTYSSENGWRITALLNSTDGSSWALNRPNQLQLAINATAVPEPATYALAGLGLAALSFWRRQL
jgi:predicted secreted protein